MRKLSFLAVLLAGALAVLALPVMSKAELTADCTVTSDNPYEVITYYPAPSSGNPATVEEVVAEIYTAETGASTYSVSCNLVSDTALNSAPMLMAAGFNINHDTWLVTEYNNTEYNFSFFGTTGDFYIPDDEDPTESDDMFVMVYIATSEDPTGDSVPTGPPASQGGGYISTTVQDFMIIPPSEDDMGFGVSLNGPVGTTGFFKMYMPPTMLALMSSYTGKTMTAADLAVFIDDMQASMNVAETSELGALISIDVVFTEGSTRTQSVTQAADTVNKSVQAKEKLALSAAFKKGTVNKGATAKLYGWKKANYSNKVARIYRKKQGADGYTYVRSVNFNNEGLYRHSFTAKAEGTFYYKVRCGTKSSTKQTLIVQ